MHSNSHIVSYFDGLSSTEHLAELKIQQGALYLIYTDNGTQIQKIWHKDHILEPDLIGGKKLSLRYGKAFPYQHIEIENKQLADQILTKFELQKKAKKYSLFTDKGAKGILLGILLFVGVFFLFYKVVIPTASNLVALSIPISAEQKMGLAIKQSLVSPYEIDSVKTKALERFYTKLNFDTEYDLNFVVVDYDMQNAFATPGGNIVVFSGIIDQMECPEDLAALIGHELTHVNERHSTKSIIRSMANAMILSVLLNDVNGITSVVVDNANTFQQLSFSRSLEKEADEFALEMLLKNNINPYGMTNLLHQLNTPLEGDFEIPEFLSSHPITNNRIKYIEKNIQKNTPFTISEPDWTEDWNILKFKDPFSPKEDEDGFIFDIQLFKGDTDNETDTDSE